MGLGNIHLSLHLQILETLNYPTVPIQNVFVICDSNFYTVLAICCHYS